MNEKTIKLINTFLIIMAIVTCAQIGYKQFQYYKDSKRYSEVKEIKPTVGVNVTKKTDEHNNNKELNLKEDKLKKINSDYKLWINIPNTDIDYPVVQGSDNEFYLHNNFNKEKSIAGAIFIDYRNKIETDRNTIFYGHHMKDGSMFNEINKYKKANEFEKGVIKIVKNKKEYNYEVFSVFVLNEKQDNLSIDFKTDKDYENYIKFLKGKSMYDKIIKNNDYSKIITLYTCSYEFSNAKTIVCAVLK
ncbi:class B sortase [Clostridium lacusfryxellense]|uniref:class B sortase n=1 Tax=Clostridium lacusfryxellense TaxID=205328 RepID=UPI001C0C0F6B|nr:class B sortase [Clostridium lacusfryxellense]MBU3114306.1 class B sortase [Clostridium lacusfryxellense]